MKESQYIELKESWRDEYLKWICGFANAHGVDVHLHHEGKKEFIEISIESYPYPISYKGSCHYRSGSTT